MIDTVANAASRRRPWVAVVLSVITTGLGQIYAGRLTRGLVFMLIGGISIPVLAGMLTLRTTANTSGLIAVMVSFVVVLIFAAIDSWIVARRAGEFLRAATVEADNWPYAGSSTTAFGSSVTISLLDYPRF